MTKTKYTQEKVDFFLSKFLTIFNKTQSDTSVDYKVALLLLFIPPSLPPLPHPHINPPIRLMKIHLRPIISLIRNLHPAS